MTILVTGGAGYIGSHVVKLLGQQGRDLVVFDNLSTGTKEAVTFGKLIVGDLNDRELVERVLKEESIQSVLHFAGSIIVPESVERPVDYYQNNTVNSLYLAQACLKAGIDKFIFSSTAAVYGIPEDGEASEETLTNPISPYGRSKLMTEWTLEDISRAHNFRSVVLRYFNVAGANVDGLVGQRSPNATHLLKLACLAALGIRDSIDIFGEDYDTEDGTCIRDYIHVDDLAQAHLDALTYLENGGPSQLLNCGYGRGISVKEMLEVVKEVSGVDFKVNRAARRPGDAPVVIAQAEKIQKVLGWKPKHNDLSLIVKTALDWEKRMQAHKAC
jgi:UDP-glucose 4-epimerase